MNLNPAQGRAVELDWHKIVCMAGPGAGKTRTAIERVKRIEGKIVVLTYTNAAADEFRRRSITFQQVTIGNVTAGHYSRPGIEFVGTLHSYCYRILRAFGQLIGYPPGDVTVLPEAERKALLKEVRDDLGYHRLSMEQLEGGTSHASLQIYAEYAFRLQRNGLVDFGRILTEGLELLQLYDVREALACDHLIVEEAQDSAWIDWEIYQAIPAMNKFYIGDIDQAIFEFRGAEPRLFLNMAKDNDAQVVKLEANYRCSKEVCRYANRLIQHNKFRYDKRTESVTGVEGWVRFMHFDDQWSELEALRAELRRWEGEECAVLCRTNYLAQIVAEYLGPNAKVFHDHGFYRPLDWNLAMLLIALRVSPNNELLAEQWLKLAAPSDEVKRWRMQDRAEGKDFLERVRLNEPDAPLARYLVANHVSTDTMRLIEIKANELPEGAALSDLLHELRAHEEPRYVLTPGTIYVGTMHSAKGREFDYVMLPGFEDARSFDENIEEERRLVYVALTRARQGVYISCAGKRKGKWGWLENQKPSRFLAELGIEI